MTPCQFRQALEHAYPIVYSRVRNYLRRRRLRRGCAEDAAENATQHACQQACLVYAKDANAFVDGVHLENWMTRTALNYLHSQARRAECRLRDPTGLNEEDLADRPTRDPWEDLGDYLQQLPDDEQRVLKLFYIENLTDVEIGEILWPGPKPTAAAKGQRARKIRLRAQERLLTLLLEAGWEPEDLLG